jgi:predicted GIY-YIG superfamily endonuclease
MENTYTSNDINIYVLECSDNKYYIGKTSLSIDIRFSQHLTDDNCAFTTKYKPIKILETIKTDDSLDEDKITKKYMIQYGIENVRGGSYTKLKLDDWMIKSLEHEFKSSQDICYKCNTKGHFTKDCETDNFNIKKYISKFNKLDELSNEINRLKPIYDYIIQIQKNIDMTNIFNIKLIDYIKKYNEIKSNIDKITTEIQTKYEGKRCFNNTEEYDRRHLEQKKQDLEKQLCEIPINSIYINNQLSRAWTECFKDEKYYPINEIDLMIYKLIIFNLENKARLKELVIEFKTDKNMKLILTGLYEKKIKLLQN